MLCSVNPGESTGSLMDFSLSNELWAARLQPSTGEIKVTQSTFMNKLRSACEIYETKMQDY